VPRPRKAVSSPNLSHGQASYVLDRMVSERRISQGEILRYVNEMQREINELEKRLQSLRAAAGGGGGYAGGGGSAAAPRRRGRPPGSRNRAKAGAAAGAASAEGGGAKRGRRGRRARANITPEQLASRQLQGRYLGLIRQIPASKRGQYQKIAKDKGREAAIKEMAGALGK
jgi:hypothetical protein